MGAGLECDPCGVLHGNEAATAKPRAAGNIAMKLGEDPEHWIAVAALEAAPDSELLARLKKTANSWRKR